MNTRKIIKRFAVIIFLLLPTITVFAKENYKECVSIASKEYRVPSELIEAILHVEGGKVGSMIRNKNGTYDLGPMQINTIWLKTLKKYGITKDHLRWDACTNIRIGTWILKSEIVRVRGDFWRGVGNYHSRTPYYHNIYLRKVVNAIKRNRVGTR